jgi:hypothetical protein
MSSEVIVTCDRCNGKIRSDEHYCADCLSSVESDRDKYKDDFKSIDARSEADGIRISDLQDEVRLLKDQVGERDDEVKRLTGELENLKSMEPR